MEQANIGTATNIGTDTNIHTDTNIGTETGTDTGTETAQLFFILLIEMRGAVEQIVDNAQQYLIDPAKEEIERGIWDLHGEESVIKDKKDEDKEDEDEKPPLTDEEQKKLDEQAADDLAKNSNSTETTEARKSFSERFKSL